MVLPQYKKNLNFIFYFPTHPLLFIFFIFLLLGHCIILLDFISVQHYHSSWLHFSAAFFLFQYSILLDLFSTAFFFKTNTNNSEWEKLYFEKQIMGLIRYKTNYGLIGNMKSGELSKSCKLIEKLMNKHFTLCSVIDMKIEYIIMWYTCV